MPDQIAVFTGKQLASAAVSIRQGIGGGNSTGGNSTDGKPGRRHTRDDAVSTQKALDLLDANEAQTGECDALLSAGLQHSPSPAACKIVA